MSEEELGQIGEAVKSRLPAKYRDVIASIGTDERCYVSACWDLGGKMAKATTGFSPELAEIGSERLAEMVSHELLISIKDFEQEQEDEAAK